MLIDCICFVSLKRLLYKFIFIRYIISRCSFEQSVEIVKDINE